MTELDSTGRIIGAVAGLKFDAKGPALQLKKQTQVKQNIVDIAELERILIAKTNMPRKKLYDRIRADFNLANVSAVTSEHIINWTRSGGYATIPMKEVTQMKDVNYTFTVPWEHIKKLGDVIILDTPIDELVK
jgi:sporulation protein YlmC with PRC-barrel domain